MLSLIFPSVAATPLDRSVPLPLSAKTEDVVPPVSGLNGVLVKSSSIASIEPAVPLLLPSEPSSILLAVSGSISSALTIAVLLKFPVESIVAGYCKRYIIYQSWCYRRNRTWKSRTTSSRNTCNC